MCTMYELFVIICDCFVVSLFQILRKHVMIRVGGGWDTLEHYLDRHDPCRCNFQGLYAFVFHTCLLIPCFEVTNGVHGRMGTSWTLAVCFQIATIDTVFQNCFVTSPRSPKCRANMFLSVGEDCLKLDPFSYAWQILVMEQYTKIYEPYNTL